MNAGGRSLRARVRAIFARNGIAYRQLPAGGSILDLHSENVAIVTLFELAQLFLRDGTSRPHLRLVKPRTKDTMDPTQVFIDLFTALETLEAEFDENPKSEAVELARTEAIGHLNALSHWLGPLNGFPPKISEVDFENDDDNDD